MGTAFDTLVQVLTPERLDDDRFRGIGSYGDGADGTFGGHLLGQASAAALATVEPERHLHSVHGYFLRGGQPGEPYEYEVERVRDGRSFCSRRVTAVQDGRSIFQLSASFASEQSGPLIKPSPPGYFDDLPRPETLPTYHELMSSLDPLPLPADWALREHGVDVRVVYAPWSPRGVSPDQGICMWIKAAGPMPENPHLHAAMLCYQSDESISDNVLVPFGVTWGTPDIVFVSLDHAMWFHRPCRMDQWHFVEQWAVAAERARGLATARVWTEDGELVATFTQEALLRLPE